MKIERAYVTLMGGLGNQIFQYAAALSLNPNEIFLVTNIGDPRKSHGLEDIFYFRLQDNVKEVKIEKSKKIISKLLNFLLRKNLQNKKNFFISKTLSLFTQMGKWLLSLRINLKIDLFIDTDLGYGSKVVSKYRNIYLHSYFQSYLFVSQKSVMEKIRDLQLIETSSILTEYIDRAMRTHPLIVHVRRGDYRNESQFGLLNEKYYEKAIDAIADRREISEIWLFSDEPHVAKFLIPEKYRTKLVEIPHFDDKPSTTLELMRYGSAYVIANSSFSWWSAMLSKSSDPLVVAPSVWFKSMQQPRYLIPESWIRIESHFE